jgi:hypothetical protein
VNGAQEVTYTLSSGRVRKPAKTNEPVASIPRIARLMALAIRFEGLVRDEAVRDYAELAQLGGVTRARMTQITKLLQLASDLQEQIMFLPEIKGLNERNLRAIVQQLDWTRQRRMFKKIMAH